MKSFTFAVLTALTLLAGIPLLSGAASAEIFPPAAGGVQGGTNG